MPHWSDGATYVLAKTERELVPRLNTSDDEYLSRRASRLLHCFAKATQCKHWVRLAQETSPNQWGFLFAKQWILRSLGGAGWVCIMPNMHYVYILKSDKDNSLYFGCTENIKKRIKEHNSGKTDWLIKQNEYLPENI